MPCIVSRTDRNYGISYGFENYSKKNYGLQMGVLNHIWSGREIEKHTELLQFCGINIADSVFIGLLNDTDKEATLTTFESN